MCYTTFVFFDTICLTNSSTLIQSEQEYGFEGEKFEKLKSRSRTSSRSRRKISITDGLVGNLAPRAFAKIAPLSEDPGNEVAVLADFKRLCCFVNWFSNIIFIMTLIFIRHCHYGISGFLKWLRHCTLALYDLALTLWKHKQI